MRLFQGGKEAATGHPECTGRQERRHFVSERRLAGKDVDPGGGLSSLALPIDSNFGALDEILHDVGQALNFGEACSIRSAESLHVLNFSMIQAAVPRRPERANATVPQLLRLFPEIVAPSGGTVLMYESRQVLLRSARLRVAGHPIVPLKWMPDSDSGNYVAK
jgi:hypothetical protein